MASSSSSHPSSSWITGEELKSFHWIEREIFSRLVIELNHSIQDSVRVIGLWLWLEEMGFSNLIFILLSKPDFIVNLVVNEALNCLNGLESMVRREQFQSQSQSEPLKNNEEEESENISLGLTIGLLNIASLSPRFFSDKKISAIRSVNRFVTVVSPRAFDDLIHKAQLLVGLSRFQPFGGGGEGTNQLAQSSLMGSGTGPAPSMSPQGLVPSAMGFRLGSLVEPSHSQFVVGGPSSSVSNPMVGQPPILLDLQMTPSDRTLFVTFSRGYPITDGELREFFTSNFGDCIENIHLQGMQQPHEQALFALIVLRSSVLLDLILEGSEDGKVRFVINGKHARARKYLTKGS